MVIISILTLTYTSTTEIVVSGAGETLMRFMKKIIEISKVYHVVQLRRGRFFFGKKDSNVVTVNGEGHWNLLREFFGTN